MELPEVGSAQGEQLAARHAAERHPYSSVQLVQAKFWVQQARVWSFEQEGWTAALAPEERMVCSSVLMKLLEAGFALEEYSVGPGVEGQRRTPFA